MHTCVSPLASFQKVNYKRLRPIYSRMFTGNYHFKPTSYPHCKLWLELPLTAYRKRQNPVNVPTLADPAKSL